MRLIASDGSIVDCSADDNPEIFHAARVGLGALGVISTVTLQCVPSFHLHAREVPDARRRVLAHLDEHIACNDHFEFYWVTGTRWALAKFNNRTEADGAAHAPPSSSSETISLFNNVASGSSAGSAACWPSLIPRIAKLMPSGGATEYVDKLLPRFLHTAQHPLLRDGVRDPLRSTPKRPSTASGTTSPGSGLILSFPIEVRFTIGDDIPLSTATARKTCYIACPRLPAHRLPAVLRGRRRHHGRLRRPPPLGQAALPDRRDPRPALPRMGRLPGRPQRLDPEGRFSNPYLDRVIGPVG